MSKREEELFAILDSWADQTQPSQKNKEDFAEWVCLEILDVMTLEPGDKEIIADWIDKERYELIP